LYHWERVVLKRVTPVEDLKKFGKLVCLVRSCITRILVDRGGSLAAVTVQTDASAKDQRFLRGFAA
jgi:hypothetical protein